MGSQWSPIRHGAVVDPVSLRFGDGEGSHCYYYLSTTMVFIWIEEHGPLDVHGEGGGKQQYLTNAPVEEGEPRNHYVCGMKNEGSTMEDEGRPSAKSF